jgi:hypothetical protein
VTLVNKFNNGIQYCSEIKRRMGDIPCDHPRFEKVYFTGAFLLNYACTQCGKDFTIAQKLEIDEMRKKKVTK